jgi:hypothetical protein
MHNCSHEIKVLLYKLIDAQSVNKLPSLLWNLNANYRFHKILPLGPIFNSNDFKQLFIIIVIIIIITHTLSI